MSWDFLPFQESSLGKVTGVGGWGGACGMEKGKGRLILFCQASVSCYMIPRAGGQDCGLPPKILRAVVNGLWRGDKMRVTRVDREWQEPVAEAQSALCTQNECDCLSGVTGAETRTWRRQAELWMLNCGPSKGPSIQKCPSCWCSLREQAGQPANPLGELMMAVEFGGCFCSEWACSTDPWDNTLIDALLLHENPSQRCWGQWRYIFKTFTYELEFRKYTFSLAPRTRVKAAREKKTPWKETWWTGLDTGILGSLLILLLDRPSQWAANKVIFHFCSVATQQGAISSLPPSPELSI